MRTLIDQLQARAVVQGRDVAYTFLDDGEREGAKVTWAEVEERSRAVAAALQQRVAAGVRAVVMFPPSLEFIPAFFGCLYAGVIAVPTYPPTIGRSDRTLGRLRGMAADADVSVVLTTTELMRRRELLQQAVPALATCEWIATDALPTALSRRWRAPHAGRDTVAFLQYTSGSTSEPRGVMVTHGNLLHNLSCAARMGPLDKSTVGVCWLPVSHDMGLIQGILQPAFSGNPMYLMAPAAFLQKPARWLEAISRYRATCGGAPNFAYDLCARRVTDEQRRSLDLRRWRIAFNGSEPVRGSTLDAFHAAFAGCGFERSSFRPAYGLAEATLLVATGRAAAATGPAQIDCGSPSEGTRIAIVDPETRTRRADGDEGEIWVSGPSVAAGYWRRPDETAHVFAAHLADSGDGPFLRTGDLGVIRDGRLVVSGRLKDVLIVRGMKHFPQDVEASVETAVAGIRPGCCAAFTVASDDGDHVVVAAEIESRTPAQTMAEPQTVDRIRRAVADGHGIQLDTVVLLRAGTIPKTTSGKLQRYACRAALLTGELKTLWRWSRHPGPSMATFAEAAS